MDFCCCCFVNGYIDWRMKIVYLVLFTIILMRLGCTHRERDRDERERSRCMLLIGLSVFSTVIVFCLHAIFKLLQTWNDGRLMDAIIMCWCSFQWPRPWCKVTVGQQRQKQISIDFTSTTKQTISIKLATTVAHFFYTTLTLKTFLWLDYLVFVPPAGRPGIF